jgi:hypothetical protein
VPSPRLALDVAAQLGVDLQLHPAVVDRCIRNRGCGARSSRSQMPTVTPEIQARQFEPTGGFCRILKPNIQQLRGLRKSDDGS